MKSYFCYLLGLLFAYTLGTFVMWDADPSNWGALVRFAFLVIGLLAGFLAAWAVEEREAGPKG